MSFKSFNQFIESSSEKSSSGDSGQYSKKDPFGYALRKVRDTHKGYDQYKKLDEAKAIRHWPNSLYVKEFISKTDSQTGEVTQTPELLKIMFLDGNLDALNTGYEYEFMKKGVWYREPTSSLENREPLISLTEIKNKTPKECFYFTVLTLRPYTKKDGTVVHFTKELLTIDHKTKDLIIKIASLQSVQDRNLNLRGLVVTLKAKPGSYGREFYPVEFNDPNGNKVLGYYKDNYEILKLAVKPEFEIKRNNFVIQPDDYFSSPFSYFKYDKLYGSLPTHNSTRQKEFYFDYLEGTYKSVNSVPPTTHRDSTEQTVHSDTETTSNYYGVNPSKQESSFNSLSNLADDFMTEDDIPF